MVQNISTGQKQSANLTAVMLPYRIWYAALAADFGLVNEASQLCASATATFNSLGGKVPPGLLVARAAASELQMRLQSHAQVNPPSMTAPRQLYLLLPPCIASSDHVYCKRTPLVCLGSS